MNNRHPILIYTSLCLHTHTKYPQHNNMHVTYIVLNSLNLNCNHRCGRNTELNLLRDHNFFFEWNLFGLFDVVKCLAIAYIFNAQIHCNAFIIH